MEGKILRCPRMMVIVRSLTALYLLSSVLEVVARASSPAKPYSWPPSESWDGADGDWSSFGLRLGHPEQGVRLLPSTTGQSLSVVAPEGCLPGEHGKTAFVPCVESRGESFDLSHSTSWKSLGNFTMDLETNLGYNDSATFGLEKVALGDSEAIGGPHLKEQVVAAFANDDFYIGSLGLNVAPSNFTNVTSPRPSLLRTLKDESLIPSLSWGYTAGAHYQSKAGAFASLTLGGYDASRMIENDVTFTLAPDNTRDLVVGLQALTANFTNGSTLSLLTDPIYTFIDSTIPYVYLPMEACEIFERTFGLTWNETYEFYFVDEDLHQALLKENSSITFKLGNSKIGAPNVDIILPYSSFDLFVDYPLVPTNISGMKYFPLMRATNESQYTLGRAFLQEAYLITDYEHANFSVHQSKYEDGIKPQVVAIPPVTTTADHGLDRTIKIGIGIGVGAFFLFCLSALTLCLLARRRKSHKGRSEESSTAVNDSVSEAQTPIPIQEISAGSFIDLYAELPSSGTPELPGAVVDRDAKYLIPPGIAVSGLHELSEPSAPIAHEIGDRKSADMRP